MLHVAFRTRLALPLAAALGSLPEIVHGHSVHGGSERGGSNGAGEEAATANLLEPCVPGIRAKRLDLL